jgi:large subunit ribosomal protein L2
MKIAGKQELMLPTEGMSTGQVVEFRGSVAAGNIVELRNVPEGLHVCNIELRPGDGGKICRAPGSAALMITRGDTSCVVELPSKKQVTLNARCLATVGVPAGGGRLEKPFRKAGNKWHATRAVGRYWPVVSGVSMNPVDHPFGGKTGPGKSVTVSRHRPPGAKVGSISAKRTGKRKR